MGHYLFWYGTGQLVEHNLVVDVRIPPAGIRNDEWVLTIRLNGASVVEGAMVVVTASENDRIRVISITHDPDTTDWGSWRGELKGEWPVHVGKRVRLSRFDREEVV